MIDSWLGHSSPLLIFAVLGACGILMGKVFESFRLPHISGQLLAGIILGPTVLNLFTAHSLHEVHVLSTLVLGIMTFTVGTHLNFRVLHNSWTRIWKLALIETSASFIAVTGIIHHFGGQKDLSLALLLGAISIATAPGTIISLIRQKKARGMLIKTLLGLVAFNNVTAIIVFEFFKRKAIASAGGKTAAELFTMKNIALSLGPVAISLIIGGITGMLLARLLKRHHHGRDLFGYAFLLIITNLVIAEYVPSLSPLLLNLAAGIALSNFSSHTRRVLGSFDNVTELIYGLFFVMAGTHLNLKLLAVAGTAGALFVIVRAITKVSAIYFAAKIFNIPDKLGKYLGISLIPQAGLAVGLVISLGNIPSMADTEFLQILSTIVLAAVAVNEMIGPFTTSKSFDLSGETGQGNPRLVDFLHEEFIMMPLKATDKWDAINQLCKFLRFTHHVDDVSEQELCDLVVEREKQFTTGIGSGIALPHARLNTHKNELMGVIGILPHPIEFDSIDEAPVNVIILIATPLDQEKLHLKVCSQVAKIFGTDPVFHQRLVETRDAAEAYDLLQSREIQEINVFLEDC